MAEKPSPALESAKSLRAKFLQSALRRKSNKGVYTADGKLLSEKAAPQRQLPAPQGCQQGEPQSWEEHSPSLRHEYLEELFQSAPEAIAIVDSSYRVARVNSEFTRMFGYTSEEAVGRKLEDLTVPASRLHESRWVIEAAEKGQKVSLKTRRHRKDGSLVEVSVLAMPARVGGAVAGYAIYRDIGETQRAEALQSALYRIAEKTSSAGDLKEFYAAIHGIVGELMYAKNFYIALFDPGTQLLSFDYFVDEEDPPFPPKPLGKGLTEYVLRTGEPLLATPEVFEDLVRRGEVQSIGAPSVDWLGVPLKSGDNTFGALVVQSYNKKVRYGEKEKDILNFVSQHVASAIEHKRHEDALRRSEARYRSFVQSAVYSIFRCSMEGKFLDVNAALVNMLGYDSAEQVLSLDPRHDVFCDPRQQVRLAQEYERSGRVENVELQWRRKGGKIITVRLSGREVTHEDGSGKVLEMIAEDITERRALEEQFRQSQKMEAVGRLAGGVAHDFNNLLTVISGYAELLLKQLEPEHPLRESAEAIHVATQRAASLTQQLLAFGRKQVLELRTINLNAVLEDVGQLLGPLLGRNVELVSRPAERLGLTKADPGQMAQVIMNLAVNARDAMPDGGTLIVETANVELDDAYHRGHFTLQPGPYVMLAISDTGSGMDADTQSRIFEPFFTTKEKGKGTGLGLSTVYGIVQQSGGHIFVYSEVGRGTTFKIYFPRVEEGAGAAGESSCSQARVAGGETVLLVEDEEAVRELVRDTLKRHGYSVLEASSGEEALKIAVQCGHSIHMMISDVGMPGIGGRELARRISADHPHVKILFVSGYTEDAIQHHGVLDEGAIFLQKPFTLDALARKVRAILDSPIPN